MPNRTELLRQLADESGVQLRTCLEYDGESMRYLYRRDDIDTDGARDRAQRLSRLYDAENELAAGGGLEEKGALLGSVHYFEDLLVLTLPDGADPTFGFSVSIDIGSDLTAFIDSCRETLFDEE